MGDGPFGVLPPAAPLHAPSATDDGPFRVLPHAALLCASGSPARRRLCCANVALLREGGSAAHLSYAAATDAGPFRVLPPAAVLRAGCATRLPPRTSDHSACFRTRLS